MSASFTKVVLFTDKDGKAKFREEAIALNEGTPQAALAGQLVEGADRALALLERGLSDYAVKGAGGS